MFAPCWIEVTLQGQKEEQHDIYMIFTVRQVQEKCLERNLDLYSMLIDLTKASDAVNKEALWDVLVCYGCPPRFI